MGFGNKPSGVGFGGYQPAPMPSPAPGGAPGQQGGTGGVNVPSWLGPLLYGAGSLYGSYTQNQNAKANTNAQNQHNAAIAAAAGQLNWGEGSSPSSNALLSILGLAPQISSPQSLLSQDSIMQLMRSNPADKALNAMVTNGGNPFDSSKLLASLGAVDQANTSQQVAGLRAGFSGLGARFGSAAATGEASLRQGISRDINARNASIDQSGYEAGQGRALSAAQLLSGNQNNAISALLQAASLSNSFNQQGYGNQLNAANQLFQQELARRGYNANLLGMSAGLNPAPITAPGYGGSISDIGQILTLLPFLTGR